MKLLFVDDMNICNYNEFSKQHEISVAKNKKDALKLINEKDFAAIFVNVKFNNDFVEHIKSLDKHANVYLLNNRRDNVGLAEHASLIDGYFVSPSQDKIERILYKVALRANYAYSHL